MSIFTKIFKRKPGGTMLGNLIRGAVKSIPVVGSALGNGAMMITEEEADRRDMSDADYLAKYGVNKSGQKPSVLPYIKDVVGAAVYGAAENVKALNDYGTNAQNATGDPVKGAANATLAKYGKIVAAVIGAVIMVILIIKIKKK